MNIRSLTRGDGAVIGAALLLLIASFLTFLTVNRCQDLVGIDCSVGFWDSAKLPTVTSVHLAGLIAAGLIVGNRLVPEGRTFAGLSLDQWGTALSVFVAWTAFWALFSAGESASLAVGAYLTLLFALLLAAAAVARPLVPALASPLLPPARPKPAQQPGQQGGYGYPGQQGGYGYQAAGGGPAYAGGSPAAGQGQAQGHGQGGLQQGVAAPDFAPFWFAVPVNRPLFPEDGSAGAPVAELNPGVWYLAVDQRGQALVAQTQDGRRGVLQDTSGIQRG